MSIFARPRVRTLTSVDMTFIILVRGLPSLQNYEFSLFSLPGDGRRDDNFETLFALTVYYHFGPRVKTHTTGDMAFTNLVEDFLGNINMEVSFSYRCVIVDL